MPASCLQGVLHDRNGPTARSSAVSHSTPRGIEVRPPLRKLSVPLAPVLDSPGRDSDRRVQAATLQEVEVSLDGPTSRRAPRTTLCTSLRRAANRVVVTPCAEAP